MGKHPYVERGIVMNGRWPAGLPFKFDEFGDGWARWQGRLGEKIVKITVTGIAMKLPEWSYTYSEAFLSSDVSIHRVYRLPFAGCQYTKGVGVVWFMATIDDRPLTVQITNLRGLKERTMEDAFNNATAEVTCVTMAFGSPSVEGPDRSKAQQIAWNEYQRRTSPYPEYAATPPWQLTRTEYYARVKLPAGWKQKGFRPIFKRTKRGKEILASVITPDGQVLYPMDSYQQSWARSKYEDDHREKVQQALDQGLPVPAKVLADYPGLKRTGPTRLPSTEQDLCPVCGGPLVYMGTLGRKKWYRCRNCGMEVGGPSPRELPKIRGYTIDERLREFRRLEPGKKMEYVPFDSPKGKELLEEMRKKGVKP